MVHEASLTWSTSRARATEHADCRTRRRQIRARIWPLMTDAAFSRSASSRSASITRRASSRCFSNAAMRRRVATAVAVMHLCSRLRAAAQASCASRCSTRQRSCSRAKNARWIRTADLVRSAARSVRHWASRQRTCRCKIRAARVRSSTPRHQLPRYTRWIAEAEASRRVCLRTALEPPSHTYPYRCACIAITFPG